MDEDADDPKHGRHVHTHTLSRALLFDTHAQSFFEYHLLRYSLPHCYFILLLFLFLLPRPRYATLFVRVGL
jgi:hypothetical protein